MKPLKLFRFLITFTVACPASWDRGAIEDNRSVVPRVTDTGMQRRRIGTEKRAWGNCKVKVGVRFELDFKVTETF